MTTRTQRTELTTLTTRLLEVLGVSLNDLQLAPPTPIVREYLPRVRAAASPALRRSYGSYWNRAEAAFGDLALDQVDPSDIQALAQQSRECHRENAATRTGKGASETCMRAMRNLFTLAVKDGWVASDRNPAAPVPLPRRLASPRFGLSSRQLAEINEVVETGGNDIELDTLIHRLHMETACRRGGALNLRIQDLNPVLCLVQLREKGGTVRWQPVTPYLMERLVNHALDRGARHAGDAVLRYANGRPLTARRYDTLWKRIRAALPWAKALGVSAHWLRHSVLTWVERVKGYGVARAYAGHTDRRGGSTTSYIKADVTEVARALSQYTGEPHPMESGDHDVPLPGGVLVFQR